MKQKLPERRRFVRVEVPLEVTVTTAGMSEKVVTKNISPVGMRFEIARPIKSEDKISMDLSLPSAGKTVKLDGKVVWQKKNSLEDDAPYDVGVEIMNIEEKNKNVFLKYLCDILYKSTYEERT
ncbi:MAG: PilZ domain-containing protein [Candidatus Omnitrophota bacterium]